MCPFYSFSKSLFHDELEIEQILIELLQDILEAQNHNETAEEYFGKDPQEQLDILLSQLPKIPFKKKVSLISIVFMISSGFSSIINIIFLIHLLLFS